MTIILFLLVFSLSLQGSLGELICDELPAGMCAFSIASSGKRCSLETGDEAGVFHCTTSEILVDSMNAHIETDDCLISCGADRNNVGISSDSLLDPFFTAKLCSEECLNNCPNIVDLYSNLALAEGTLLSKLCKTLAMSQLQSSGVAANAPVAEGPISAAAPAVSPAVGGGSAPGAAPGPL